MFVSRRRLLYSHTVLNFRILLVVLLLQWTCQDPHGIHAEPIERVVGGTDAPRGRFQYMCSLRQRGSRVHMCGGTLIKPRWVITAAHCLERQHAGMNPIVHCGIYERNERNSSKAFAADRIAIHPQWNGDFMGGYDIALIQLDRASDSPLPDLATQGSLQTSGNVFSALGWGFTSDGGFADLLQIAHSLPFVVRRICNTEDYWDNQIIESMLCAGTGHQDTDQGDSGGPLLQLDFHAGDYTLGDPSFDLLVGITSFGERSGDTFKPGVYTRIAYFRNWIDCIIEEKTRCWNESQETIESPDDVEDASPTSDIISLIEQDLQPATTSEVAVASTESYTEQLAESPEPLAGASSEAANTAERNTTSPSDRIAQLATLRTPSGCGVSRGRTYPSGIILARQSNTTSNDCCDACRESSACLSWYHDDRTSTYLEVARS